MRKRILILSAIFGFLLLTSVGRAQNRSADSSSSGSMYAVGDLVEAADHRGVWYKSKITDEDNGKYHVHFFGWSKDWDEWVTPDKIRYSNDYEFGREVEVEQNGVWYKALLVDSRYGTEHLVSYVNYDEEEWVKNERIRYNGSASNYRRGGKLVEVADKKKPNKWWRATILKRREGEVYVHYEGYEDVWNEWISVDRIREIR